MRLKERIELALDEVRPQLQMEGGDVTLVELDEDAGVVYVRLLGLCSACSMSQVTLKVGVERTLRRRFPEIMSVEGVE